MLGKRAQTPSGRLPRRPRWGLRTLGFLALATVAIVTAINLGGHTLGTFGSLVFGLVGAAYCSVKGMNQALEHGELGELLARRRRR
jgi:peptidoglycan/LPS O-acetylase OafA/YrhL